MSNVHTGSVRTIAQKIKLKYFFITQMQGLLVDVDNQSGKATAIAPVVLDVEVEIPAPKNEEKS